MVPPHAVVVLVRPPPPLDRSNLSFSPPVFLLSLPLELFLTRTWSHARRKFVVINLLIVFTIGTTAFTALLNAFSSPTSVLDVVAGAFPRAATFYVSYLLLQVGVQTGVELALLGISWINHASIRKYVAPRKRALENIPRFFGAQTWCVPSLSTMEAARRADPSRAHRLQVA